MPKKKCVYEAPTAFVLGFYGLIVVWSCVSTYLIVTKAIAGSWPVVQLFMIGFVVAYTWYWCLGISYRITVTESGGIELRSFRKVLRLEASEVRAVEAPKLSVIPTVFIRFRLAVRVRAYMFCVISNSDFSNVLQTMRMNNNGLVFKGLVGVI